jgi:hypothetical protein
VVLVIAIVVVVIVRSGSKGGTPVAGHSTSPTSLVDPCLVGTWRITKDEQDVVVTDVGNVRFTGQGAQVRLKADGTGVQDYQGSSPYVATLKGQKIELTVDGKITFGYRTLTGTVAFSDVNAQGNATMKVDGVLATSVPLEADNDPATYTCTDGTLKETTSLRTVSMTRISRSA